jgi:hypothetical protein
MKESFEALIWQFQFSDLMRAGHCTVKRVHDHAVCFGA